MECSRSNCNDAVKEPGQVPIIEPSRWQRAWEARLWHHSNTIRFDRPTHTLPVSLTGSHCALRCAHCNGHYLEHMRPIWDVEPNGAKSLLVSGGCDADGRVPVTAHLDRVVALRDDGLRLNWHVGLIAEGELQRIAPYADVVSFDIVGDAETAREVYGLDLTLDDYLATYDLLCRHVPVVPHITVGLRGGTLSGERAAIEALGTRQPKVLILIILIPTQGTAYAKCQPPTIAEVTDLFLDTRVMLPDTSLILGCMRPYGAYRQAVDEIAVRAGLNGIVNPARIAVQTAEELGLEISWGDECCAFPEGAP
jgi:uncharacterized radical SAM superfamily protein